MNASPPITARARETIEDMNNLRHTLGVGNHIRKRDWGYRNYFNAGEGHADMPSLLRLEAAGLMERYRPDYWRATMAGAHAIGLSEKLIAKIFSAS